jgi:hypothetical protein
MQLVRILYASKATNVHPTVKTDLMHILDCAVDFNYRHQITGVLYYGFGYFVQCIEGPKETIDNLFYNRIIKDPRHKNCKILSYTSCEEIIFKNWNMKFAPVNKSLKQFFSDYHLAEFNPYLLSNKTIPHFIEILAQQPDSSPHDDH